MPRPPAEAGPAAASCPSSWATRPGLASVCGQPCRLRPAMRWLWHMLGVSLAVALAAGPRAPGALRLAGWAPACGQKQPDGPGEGPRWEDAKRLQQCVPEGGLKCPRPIRPAALQPTQPPGGRWPLRTGPERLGQRAGARGNVSRDARPRLQVQNPLYPVTGAPTGASPSCWWPWCCSPWAWLRSAWRSCRRVAQLLPEERLELHPGQPGALGLPGPLLLPPHTSPSTRSPARLLGAVSCRAVPFVEVSVWPGRPTG